MASKCPCNNCSECRSTRHTLPEQPFAHGCPQLSVEQACNKCSARTWVPLWDESSWQSQERCCFSCQSRKRYPEATVCPSQPCPLKVFASTARWQAASPRRPIDERKEEVSCCAEGRDARWLGEQRPDDSCSPQFSWLWPAAASGAIAQSVQNEPDLNSTARYEDVTASRP